MKGLWLFLVLLAYSYSAYSSCPIATASDMNFGGPAQDNNSCESAVTKANADVASAQCHPPNVSNGLVASISTEFHFTHTSGTADWFSITSGLGLGSNPTSNGSRNYKCYFDNTRDRCPPLQSVNVQTGACELTPCGPDEYRDLEHGGACVKYCPDERYEWDPALERCVIAGCPEGQARDLVTLMCLSICPENAHFDPESETCRYDACPDGSSRQAPSFECAEDCTKPEQFFNPTTHQCEWEECPDGQSRNLEGICEKICPYDGQEYDPVTGMCKWSDCPDGQTRCASTSPAFQCVPFAECGAEDMDLDGDGKKNSVDEDDDGDGVEDSEDPDPNDPTVPGVLIIHADTDGDGIIDLKDPDIDGDGILNEDDSDDDGDGIFDDRDIGSMTGYDIEKIKKAVRAGKESAKSGFEDKLQGMAPTWEELYQRAVIGSQAVPIVAFGRELDFSIPSGSCPTFSGHVAYLNTDFVIDAHCQVWPVLSTIISPIMYFFYSYKAFRLFIR